MKSRLCCAASLVLAVACMPEESGTGGRTVYFDLAVESPSYMARRTFVTELGWEVELQEAFIVVGPFYLWEAPSLASRSGHTRKDRDLLGWVGDLLVPTAWAHPGDRTFDGKAIRGELLGQYVYDLTTGEPAALGLARGIEGEVGSMTVVLDPPGAAAEGDVAALHGHHAWVKGIARRDGEDIAFEGGLDIPAEGTQREVEGLPLDLTLEDDGMLVVGLHPKVWFDQAQFDTLQAPSDGGPRIITPDSQVGVAWFLGARSPAAFYAEWIRP